MWKLVVDQQRDTLRHDTRRTSRGITGQRIMGTDPSPEEGLIKGSEAHALSVGKKATGRESVQIEMTGATQSHW